MTQCHYCRSADQHNYSAKIVAGFTQSQTRLRNLHCCISVLQKADNGGGGATTTFTKLLLQEPKLETITRETIETFRGQRTECKFTTEKKNFEDKFPADLIEALTDKAKRTTKKGISKVSDKIYAATNYFSK